MTTAKTDPQVEARVDRLQAGGVVDMHYDLLMDLYEKRQRRRVLATDHLPQLQAGGMGVLGAAIYLEDKYLPEMALRVALDQVARLYAEVAETPEFAICKSGGDIARARQAGQIALVITMEGVEPLGTDLDLLRVFYELGVRSVGLTHVRRNLAGDGGMMAPSGSPGGRVERVWTGGGEGVPGVGDADRPGASQPGGGGRRAGADGGAAHHLAHEPAGVL